MTRQKPKVHAAVAAFWDTSAIVPLCCMQPATGRARQAARTYRRQIVWWVTPVEAISAFQRLSRAGHLSAKESAQTLARLGYLRSRWSEVQPGEELRAQAERLLRMHKLRAADALQLAAALVWCGSHPREHFFVSADSALTDAAGIEGFVLIKV